MKLLALSILIAAGLCGCGSRDHSPDSGVNAPELRGLTADGGRSTNLLAVSGWSKPVTDPAGYTLRGRLLLFDTPHYLDNSGEWWGNAPVYVELQNLSPRTDKALAVYFAIGDGLEYELRDEHGKPLPRIPRVWIVGFQNPRTRQNWVTVPFDGSVRLRADPVLGGFSPKPNGLDIELSTDDRWMVTPTNSACFLSGNFSPPVNHPTPPDSHVWQGKLELPAMRIPIPKP